MVDPAAAIAAASEHRPADPKAASTGYRGLYFGTGPRPEPAEEETPRACCPCPWAAPGSCSSPSPPSSGAPAAAPAEPAADGPRHRTQTPPSDGLCCQTAPL